MRNIPKIPEKSPKFTLKTLKIWSLASLGDRGSALAGQRDFSDFSMTGGFKADPPYLFLVLSLSKHLEIKKPWYWNCIGNCFSICIVIYWYIYFYWKVQYSPLFKHWYWSLSEGLMFLKNLISYIDNWKFWMWFARTDHYLEFWFA